MFSKREIKVKMCEPTIFSSKKLRRYERKPFVAPINYYLLVTNMGKLEKINGKGVLVDISEGGLGMITDYPLEIEHILILQDKVNINNITAKASVVKWALEMEKNKYRVGMEFIR